MVIQGKHAYIYNVNTMLHETSRNSKFLMQGHIKFPLRFSGLFEIIMETNDVAYGLKLPVNYQIHNVFHLLCLEKVLGHNQSAQTEIPEVDEEGRIALEPEGILATKEKVLCSKTIREYLIKWKKLLEEDSSWETEKFRQQYPSLPLL